MFGLYEPFHDAQEGPTTNARRERHWLEDTAVWRSLFDCSFALDNATLQAVAWRGEGRTKLGDQLPWGSEKERVRFRHRRGAISLSRFGPAIHKLCEQSTVRVVKTIRFAPAREFCGAEAICLIMSVLGAGGPGRSDLHSRAGQALMAHPRSSLSTLCGIRSMRRYHTCDS